LTVSRPTKAASSNQDRRSVLRIVRYIAMQQLFDNPAKGTLKPHQMKLNSSLVHGKTAKMPPAIAAA
jgi:hypothetical protein